MTHDLNIDPTTPEGKAIVDLFASSSRPMSGDADGAEFLDMLAQWFAELGSTSPTSSHPHRAAT